MSIEQPTVSALITYVYAAVSERAFIYIIPVGSLVMLVFPKATGKSAEDKLTLPFCWKYS